MSKAGQFEGWVPAASRLGGEDIVSLVGCLVDRRVARLRVARSVSH